MPNYDILKIETASFLSLDDTAIERFRAYLELLLEWNERMNLTAIKVPQEVIEKHFLDSLLFFKNIEVKNNASIIDVGTGAGFPGMVLKIARPDIKLTLLDGLNKRLVFLEEVARALDFDDINIIHARAEEGGKRPELREKFEFSTARAVARLNVLAEYCLPFVKRGGSFVALKGPMAEEELQEAKRALAILGGDTPIVFKEKLPEGDIRAIIECKKISQTSPKYPRPHAKIAKKPL